MKHTKNILKSLLITVMALSLLAVSCKKDEGGSKPTDPITPKNSEALLTEMLQRLGKLTPGGGDTTVILDLSNITPKNGEATIEGADNTKDKADNQYKVVKVLKNTFTVDSFKNEQIKLQAAPNVTDPTIGNQNALSVDITFIANTDKGYTFDDSITGKGKTTYTYDEKAKTAKLTLKITPAANWE